jgi:hypothetical protein
LLRSLVFFEPVTLGSRIFFSFLDDGSTKGLLEGDVGTAMLAGEREAAIFEIGGVVYRYLPRSALGA